LASHDVIENVAAAKLARPATSAASSSTLRAPEGAKALRRQERPSWYVGSAAFVTTSYEAKTAFPALPTGGAPFEGKRR
jgi:hypothetical protein